MVQTPPVRRRSLADLSVRVRILAVAAIGGVAAATIGVTGLVALDKSSNAAQSIYSGNLDNTAALGRIQTNVVQTRLDVANHALSTDRTSKTKYQAALEASLNAVDTAIGHYYQGPPGPDDAMMRQVQQEWSQYKTILRDQALPASDRLDVAGFVAVRDGKIIPLMKIVAGQLDHLATAEDEMADAAAATAMRDYSHGRLLSMTLLVVGLAVSFTAAWAVARGVVRSLRRVQDVCEGLADGDLTRSSGLTGGDEPGRMGRALDTAIDRLRHTVTAIDANASALAAASQEMSGSARQMSASAEETSVQAQAVSAATEQISRSVDTVSAGGEQMSAAIREISQNASEAARVASDAVSLTETTSNTMNQLGESSAEIGEVIKTITAIAEQTNLLALNATIEAARAGELGKGFAVVASEVKDLAQETARATEDISSRVESIQAGTTGAVTAIEEITRVIARISDFQTTIASAVEEQTATTNEMNRSVGQAATGTGEIAQNITGVAEAARLTSEGVARAQQSSTDLSRMAHDLSELVSGFRLS
jgi:methyl-accepting chemotaxis protein